MKKLSIVLLLLALVLALVPAAFAQDETFGASQEDFDAWTGANAATFAASSMSFDFTLSLAMPGVLAADLTGSGVIINDSKNPGLQLDVTGTAGDGEDNSPVTAGVRIVDGNIYVSEDGESWQYSSLADASSMIEGELGGLGLPIDPSMFSGDMSSLESSSGMMAGLEGLNPSDFLSLTRDGDQFTFSVDVEALASSPALAPVLAGAMGGAASGQQMTDAQTQQMAQMMGAMLAKAVVQLIQDVDPGSQMVTATELNVEFPGLGLTLNLTVNLSGFGETYTIEAPEGAEPMSS